jgi:hypothetical protein
VEEEEEEEAGWPGAREAAGSELGRRREEQGEEAVALSEGERKGVFPKEWVLAAFCSSLCAYRWSSYSSPRARK